MKNILKTKKLYVCLLSLLLISCLILAFTFFPVKAQSKLAENLILVDDVKIESTYSLNTIIQVPEAKLKLNDKEYDSCKTVISPTDKHYDSSKVILNETGVWTLLYENFETSDRIYIEKTFSVVKNNFEVTSPEGSISYGANEYHVTHGDGLNVSLPSGAEFKCYTPIDISQNDRLDGIIEFGLAPEVRNTAEVGKVVVRLTDCYEPNNYIEYIINQPGLGNPESYTGLGSFKGTFSGQDVYMGNEAVKAGKIIYYVNDVQYGAYVRFSFDRNVQKAHEGTTTYLAKLCYDYEQKEMHANTKIWYDKAEGIYQSLIVDLDDLDYTKCDMRGQNKGFSQAFKGFSNGKVLLSIYCDGYTGSTCNMFIKNIQGVDFTEEGFENKTYGDVTNPYNNVNLLGYDVNALPKAAVNKPYKIFDVRSYDDSNGNLECKIQVFKVTEEGEKLYQISIKDGYFTPTKAGKYQIIYTSVDGSVNICETKLSVVCEQTINAPLVNFSSNYPATFSVGNRLTFLTPEITSYSGKYAVKTQLLLDGNLVGENLKDYLFEKTGQYTIKYIVTDYLGNQTVKEFSFSASNSIKPVAYRTPSVPDYLINNSTYTFDKGEVYYFKDGNKILVNPNISVNGNKIDGNNFTLNNFVGSNLTVKYEYKVDDSPATEFEYECAVVNISDYKTDLIKYFGVNSNVTATQKKNFVTLTYSNDAQVKFIKSIPVLQGNLVFGVERNEGGEPINNGEFINVYLQDTIHLDNVVKLTIFRNASDETSSLVKVNDGLDLYRIDGRFDGLNNFQIDIDNVKKIIKFNGNVVNLVEYSNGIAFNGFTKNKANLIFEVEGMDELEAKNFGLNILQISSQYFAETVADRRSPQGVIEGEILSNYEIGTEIELFSAYGLDVLQENVKVEVSMVDKDRNIVSSTSGEKLDKVLLDKTIKVKLNAYGNYTVTYRFIDSANNSVPITLLYSVADKIYPELNLDDKPIRVKVNEKISLPIATVSDNATSLENLVCYIMYKDPDFQTYLVKDERIDPNNFTCDFVFEKVGEWEISYAVYDEYFNLVIKTIKVKVVD